MPKWILKIITVLALVGFMGSVSLIAFTPKAEAILRIPTSNLVREAQGKFDNLNIFTELTNRLLQWADTIITTQLKQMLVNLIQDTVLGSIQGSGTNIPGFVTSYLGLQDDVTFDVMKEFAEELDATQFCPNIAVSIRSAFGASGTGAGGSSNSPFSQGVNCSLGGIIGNRPADFDQFFGGDFSKGGTEGFLAAWSPQNNIFGAYLQTYDERAKRVEEEVNATNRQVADAQGFFGTTECPRPGECLTITPGIIAKELTAKALGADLDFILNADTFFELAVNALDLLVSRTLNEGLTKISNIFDSDKLAELVQQTEDINNSNFDSTKQSTVDSIGQIVSTREQITSLLNIDLAQTNTWINKLTNWKNQIETKLASLPPSKRNATSCKKGGFSIGSYNSRVDITQLKRDIDDEIARAQSLRDPTLAGSLASKKIDNQTIIDTLNATATEIAGLDNDISGRNALSRKRDELSGVLNPADAIIEKNEVEENRDINEEIIAERATAIGDEMTKFGQCDDF